MCAVTDKAGSLGLSIHRPTAWAPDEYCMVSTWADEAALQAFAGEHWKQTVIPAGMQRFVAECWVHHYHPL